VHEAAKIPGTFHQVSKKHLPLYLAEFDHRFNHRGVTDGERTVSADETGRGTSKIAGGSSGAGSKAMTLDQELAILVGWSSCAHPVSDDRGRFRSFGRDAKLVGKKADYAKIKAGCQKRSQ